MQACHYFNFRVKINSKKGINMQNKIETNLAPKAIGPYSQAVSVPAGDRLIFVSGQLPVDPKTGEFVQGDIQALTKCVMDNIAAILKAAGSSMDKVVRADVFLKDLKRDFAGMNEEYAKHFNSPVPPARQTVQVSELPKGAIVEISVIAAG
jgi:2-iminobutanoate/2-iminopropanoate deaminase